MHRPLTALLSLLLLLPFAVRGEEPSDTRQGVMHTSFKTLGVTLGGDLFALPVINISPTRPTG